MTLFRSFHRFIQSRNTLKARPFSIFTLLNKMEESSQSNPDEDPTKIENTSTSKTASTTATTTTTIESGLMNNSGISGSIKEDLPKTMSRRAMKRQARSQQYKELKKKRKADNLVQTGRQDAGYNLEDFDQTSYYFENGLRKVYPYPYVFATHAKGRWVGRTLKNVLEKEFGFDKPDDVDKSFHQGKIHVNNAKVGVDYVVKDCDFISHQIHRHENPVTDAPLEILADTEEFLVINKPSSIPCHPCGRYRFNSVVFILGKQMGYSNLRNIYRLDRLTSGVLILGKTAAGTRRLEDQVANRVVHKEYVCRVEGEFPSETITVDQPLDALSNKLRLRVVSPKGKPSQTTFTRLSYNGRSSVVKCLPHTGRTHQIRVHLQYLGYPIINDVFYNSDAWGPNKGKGGNYHIPLEEVCSRITQKHQSTQWDGGDNPLFHQKVKEMNKLPSSTTESNNENAELKTDVVEDAPHSNSNSLDSNQGNTVSQEDGGTHYNKTQPRTAHTSSNIATYENSHANSNTNNDSSCSDENRSELKNGLRIDSTPAVESSSSVSSSDTTSLDADTVASPSTTQDRCTDLKHQEKHQWSSAEVDCPAFDVAKWHIDVTCDLCEKTTLDPKPKDLVMFLHALNYKGPDWSYETRLPDWAQPDWADEDKFMLESTITPDVTS